MLNYNLDVIFFLVPNCPLYYVGAKLSWCQIVRCQIVRFYYVGAKLSWCQIVQCQIVLVPNCPGAKLSGAKLSGAKLSHHLMDATYEKRIKKCERGEEESIQIKGENRSYSDVVKNVQK